MSEWERGPAYKNKMGDSADSSLELGHYFYRFIFCRREGNDANWQLHAISLKIRPCSIYMTHYTAVSIIWVYSDICGTLGLLVDLSEVIRAHMTKRDLAKQMGFGAVAQNLWGLCSRTSASFLNLPFWNGTFVKLSFKLDFFFKWHVDP